MPHTLAIHLQTIYCNLRKSAIRVEQCLVVYQGLKTQQGFPTELAWNKHRLSSPYWSYKTKSGRAWLWQCAVAGPRYGTDAPTWPGALTRTGRRNPNCYRGQLHIVIHSRVRPGHWPAVLILSLPYGTA